MEHKHPLNELLASIEQLADQNYPLATDKPDLFSEFERLRLRSGLGNRELARLMGVNETVVREWIARRVMPSPTALQLMRYLEAHPALHKPLTRS